MRHGHANQQCFIEETNVRFSHDLPPSSIAQSLPVGAPAKKVPNNANTKDKPHEQRDVYKNDDTPKAFVRLLQFQKTGKRFDGLDDGSRKGNKKKKDRDEFAEVASVTTKSEVLTILPGERMSDFSARVNQALPLAGTNRKGNRQPGLKERQTRTERKMQKMQADWRREEARRKGKEEEAQDVAEEEDAENFTAVTAVGNRKRRRSSVNDDPWAGLKATREQPKGLHDVVQAPPNFRIIPKEKFKVTNGATINVANVPGTAGSLRRREELGDTRQSIIDSYRQLMAGSRSHVA